MAEILTDAIPWVILGVIVGLIFLFAHSLIKGAKPDAECVCAHCAWGGEKEDLDSAYSSLNPEVIFYWCPECGSTKIIWTKTA